MSAYVGIASKDGYPYRNDLETVLKDCPVIEKSLRGGGEFLLAGGEYGFTIDWAEHDPELYLHLEGWWSEKAVDSFKQLFDWLCEHTTWDLELDWSDVLREDIYRPSQEAAA